MLKLWGWLGLILIILSELNFIFKIQPFALLYFPIIWMGYILFIDSLVFRIKKRSLISHNLPKFLGMFIISPLVWWLYEFFNLFLKNWYYTGTGPLGVYYNLFATLSFSIVIPAFFETFDLIKSLFKYEEANKTVQIKRNSPHLIIFLGLLMIALTLFFPGYLFPLIWVSVFLILDPINNLRKQPNLISYIKIKKFKIFLILSISILILGFFWEFWNYYAVIRWSYIIPFFNFFKIFEMPILGYLGYIPFSFSLYSIYYFIRSCFK